MTHSGGFSADRLGALLSELPLHAPIQPEALAQALQTLCRADLDQLPQPGSGQTLQRWQALAAVAAHDLSLCKLYEGHTDALAIMQHFAANPPPADSTWGMWAAEPPQARVKLDAEQSDGSVRLHGRKAWCSGAKVLSHGLLTAWNTRGEQQLVAVALQQPGVHITDQGWQAIGMQATQSVEILFEEARGWLVGPADGYLQRPGFWQGGAGIAACWYGSAQTIGEALRRHCARHDEPHALAHLGEVDSTLLAAASALHDCARWIDENPQANAELPVRRVRALCESSAETVIRHVGRALGAAPYCRDAALARHLADLPVFLRQSHAERDLAALGSLTARQRQGSWML
ncbi:acyl-CoA dehydrogenase family protein [Phytopseudomonas daroniae]|uniref:acyl-CoA dehydrogenase family protein n=1 Tax=Phytopseudomonas daroniae TaxID=2487519 RepID=UPI0010383504|nr:acyl-CoA dehydrogenase family protein [Pseudomonas daroniae]TBU77413.1 acyl-CoA dehydrogenase [Pseudomonas daroniae]